MNDEIETALSDVDGENGKLTLKGHDVERWAPSASFEETCALFLGDTAALWKQKLAEGRARAEAHWPSLRPFLSTTDAMGALRGAIATLPGDSSPADVIAATGWFTARWAAAKETPPSAKASHAEDFLAGINSATPTLAAVQAMNCYFATVVDHGMNASTYTARVIASTGSDLVSAVTGGIGALKGPLHGGAPGPVLDMLDAIGSADRVDAHLERLIAGGERIMGMGHRIYRVRDPRAAVLEGAIERLFRDAPNPRLALARATERGAERLLAEKHPARPLKANVEFYTAVLLEAIGIPRAAFSATFATARVVGWCAHYAEQRREGKLIRPTSHYVGPPAV